MEKINACLRVKQNFVPNEFLVESEILLTKWSVQMRCEFLPVDNFFEL